MPLSSRWNDTPSTEKTLHKKSVNENSRIRDGSLHDDVYFFVKRKRPILVYFGLFLEIL